MKFRGVEFDVMLAAGKTPVLMHDETLERTTNGRGRIADTPLDVLITLDAGSWYGARFRGEPVPSFEAAARLCRELGLWANVEIKPSRGHAQATGCIAARLASRLWEGAALPPLLSSFEASALAAARESAPALPRALLLDGIPADWHVRAEELSCVSLHCSARSLNARTVQEFTEAGYGVAAWTVNEPVLARRLFRWGVDAIFTDRLDLISPDFACK